MRPPGLRIQLDERELVVDCFAGGGGASTGIEQALGRHVDIAINHDPEAIAMHAANHPETRHYVENINDVNPREVCWGRPVGLAWFSPDCTFFSKSRGGKPFRDRNRARRRRGLAWTVVRWARAVKPRVILLENVEEFADWGPLDDDGKPDKLRRGLTFRRWVGQLRAAGYVVDSRELRACDYGAPTSRKRLFVVARCDGRPIVWPEPTHGPGRAEPWHAAAECIDWSIPCPSIFERKRPLADKTLRRIARGVFRYVLGAAEPFVVSFYGDGDGGLQRARSLDQPIATVTTARRHAIVAPTLIQTGRGEREGQAPRSLDLQAPLGTVCAGGAKHALVSAFLAKHFGGHEATGSRLQVPIGTVTTQDHHSLVAAHLTKFRGTSTGAPLDEPAPTLTAGGWHLAEVRAFLTTYYGVDQATKIQGPLPTITTRDRFAVVTVEGRDYAIADIGMRMLQPRELFRAQGFADSYIINPLVDGVPMTKTAQIERCGNSVCPPIAAALVRAQLAEGAAGEVARQMEMGW